MFTGIIEAVGSVAERQASGDDMRLRIKTAGLDLADVKPGDSIAVNGVCLTAVELPGDGFQADVSHETLKRTGIGQLREGDAVNLEKALTPETRLGGHLVSGHVDGFGEVISRQSLGRAECFIIRAPDSLAKYIAEKGSICVDGTSLTVNAVNGAEFELTIVPHTLQQTIMDSYQSGSQVNLEVDLIARYLERLLLGEDAANASTGLTEGFLAKHGFLGRQEK
ncbi:MAG TPA: riboflavin synthase [Gammaproteobacteria bacterium]|nr:riboflavin synthase [Gammaproteobacteria bacterium]